MNTVRALVYFGKKRIQAHNKDSVLIDSPSSTTVITQTQNHHREWLDLANESMPTAEVSKYLDKLRVFYKDVLAVEEIEDDMNDE